MSSMKTDRAVDRLNTIISEAIGPKEMDKTEALNVLERLRDDIEMQAETLSDEIDREEAAAHENARL